MCCWMCRVREQSIYRKCDGCGKSFDRSNLQIYDIHAEWGELAEFIEHKQRIMVFCANCRDGMNAYRESTRAHVAETEPSGWTLPAKWDPALRGKDIRVGAIPVGVRGSGEILGIRCAQRKYGINATEEILRGFIYHDDHKLIVRRVAIDEVDETTRCDKCWLRLYECNAREVTR